MAKKEHISETQATQLLRKHQVAFDECPYPYEEHGGTSVSARELGVPEHEVIKTLVMQDEAARPLIVLMHGDCKVSTKNLARQIGAKSVEPCKPDVANRHSGYLIGGTSPFGTRRYREAVQAGYDAVDPAGRMLPTVALVSRLPLAGPGVAFAHFPAGVLIPADSHAPDDNASRFARAPLHVQVILPGGQLTDVVVLHLKSRRPDYRHGDGTDALAYALANLRSLQRRGAEAVAVRVLVSELGHSGRPRIVLGDFNDIANAVTTAIVMGAGAPCAPLGDAPDMRERLYDANAIQRRQDGARHAGYTNIHDSAYMTIDHILVSEHFHPASPRAIGAVQDVVYLNDHLLLGLPQASDHGQVLARLELLGNIS